MLTREQSLELSTSVSRRLDSVEDIALRLVSFCETEDDESLILVSRAKSMATLAFMLNGEAVTNHYRRYGDVIEKSRSASDLPVSPASNYQEALTLIDVIIDELERVGEAIPALWEQHEALVRGGENGLKAWEEYNTSFKTRHSLLLRTALSIQHAVLLAVSGFDFDGINAAIGYHKAESNNPFA